MLIAAGSGVTLTIADPWDLVGSDRENRIVGFVECVVLGAEPSERDRIALRLSRSIAYQKINYDRVVLQARTEDALLEPLANGRTVEVSVYGVPAGDKLMSTDPREWWRGGLGATASATLS